MENSNSNWFKTRKVADNIYLIQESHFYEGNRCNIWLIKGPASDVIVDTGLGVCDLRQHLTASGLLTASEDSHSRPCQVVCTHNHFDHCGGAHHFADVLIHENDLRGLVTGRQMETLNYVQTEHFHKTPYPGFRASDYRVPATQAAAVRDGDRIELGGGQHLEVLHVPGHTKGSIALYYPEARYLFSGDFVYECSRGGDLIDWLPTSSVGDYVRSAEVMLDWLDEHDVASICPGHFGILEVSSTRDLLWEYVDSRNSCCTRGCMSCLQLATRAYFGLGCVQDCACVCGL